MGKKAKSRLLLKDLQDQDFLQQTSLSPVPRVRTIDVADLDEEDPEFLDPSTVPGATDEELDEFLQQMSPVPVEVDPLPPVGGAVGAAATTPVPATAGYAGGAAAPAALPGLPAGAAGIIERPEGAPPIVTGIPERGGDITKQVSGKARETVEPDRDLVGGAAEVGTPAPAAERVHRGLFTAPVKPLSRADVARMQEMRDRTKFLGDTARQYREQRSEFLAASQTANKTTESFKRAWGVEQGDDGLWVGTRNGRGTRAITPRQADWAGRQYERLENASKRAEGQEAAVTARWKQAERARDSSDAQERIFMLEAKERSVLTARARVQAMGDAWSRRVAAERAKKVEKPKSDLPAAKEVAAWKEERTKFRAEEKKNEAELAEAVLGSDYTYDPDAPVAPTREQFDDDEDGVKNFEAARRIFPQIQKTATDLAEADTWLQNYRDRVRAKPIVLEDQLRADKSGETVRAGMQRAVGRVLTSEEARVVAETHKALVDGQITMKQFENRMRKFARDAQNRGGE